MSIKQFCSKLKESFFSVFPITLIIFALIIFFIPTTAELTIKFSISSILLIIGIAFFSLGADSSMIELGNGVGTTLSSKNKLWFMLVSGVVIGFIITLAEPDLMVLAKQVAETSSLSSVWVFIVVVSLGVGLLLMLGILRIYYKIPLSILLLVSYSLVFLLSFFAPSQFVPIAFDSGSVTTGPISVPFLIAFGLGLSSIRSSKQSQDDSFGLIALCSIGPIITVMILSLFINPATSHTTQTITQTGNIAQQFFHSFIANLGDVAIIILPIIAIFIVFQIFSFKYPKTKVFRMIFGFFLVFAGISIFLTGVECGYYPMGLLIGTYLGGLQYGIIAILVALILGAFAIIAEPALHVLKKQVEDITNKTINQKVILITISLGVALSVALSCICSLYSINIMFFIIPLYLVAIVLAFVNTKLFTAISFDSGGVASGSLAVSFILPMISGLSSQSSGFGTVALIACFPIVTMQILGLIYKIKLTHYQKLVLSTKIDNDYVIEFDYTKDYKVSKYNKDEIIEFDYKRSQRRTKNANN